MSTRSLGTIEVLGLPAAVEAADVALKTADVTLIGYETTDGMGMVAVKIEGQVSAVTSAVAAASAAAAKITKVFATSVIPRPSDQLEPVVLTEGTIGLAKPAPAPAPEPVVEAPLEPVVEAVAPEPVDEPVVEAPAAEPKDDPVETPEAAPAEAAPVEATTPAAPKRAPRRTTSQTRTPKKK